MSPYHNTRAERAIIASMSKKGIAEKHISRLTPEDFYDPNHASIFNAMQRVFAEKKGIDFVLLAEMLTKLYGNDDLMETFFEITRVSLGAEFLINEHIEIVRAAAKRRNIRTALDRLCKQLDDSDTEVDAVVADVQGKLRHFNEVKSETMDLQNVLLSAFTELDERAKGKNRGMPSGLKSLDAKTAGFHKGEMTIIGARPAVGKSALAGQIALSAADHGNKVCICSREMTDVQYGIRILAKGTSVSNMRMRTGELTENDWEQLTDSMMLYSDHDIRFMFSTKYIEDLRAEVEAMKDRDGLDMLIVDYVQLLQTKQRFDKDYQRIGFISKALKDMSTELNIAVIALAQVGRSTEGDMPSLSELRGSGDLEQDADNVLFIHRPEDADDRWVKPSERGVFGAIQSMKCQYIVLNIAKQRQGETGPVTCMFNPRAMSFEPIGKEE